MSIKLEHVNYIYGEGTAYEKHALKDINLEIPDGQFLGIIGHTGRIFDEGTAQPCRAGVPVSGISAV